MATRTFFKAGSLSRADVPRDANGKWTKGNPGGGPRVSGATGKVENARGGPKENGRPQAVNLENGTRVTTRPPKGDERFADGPDVRNALLNTYLVQGMDYEPDHTALEEIGPEPKGGWNLGNAYKAVGNKHGQAGQDRLMHRWRTGQTLPTPRYDSDDKLIPDPWRVGPKGSNDPNTWDRKMGAGGFRTFRRPAEFAGGGRANVPRDNSGKWTKGAGGGAGGSKEGWGPANAAFPDGIPPSHMPAPPGEGSWLNRPYTPATAAGPGEKFDAVDEAGLHGTELRNKQLASPAATKPLSADERSSTAKLAEAKDWGLLEDMDEYAPSLTAGELGNASAESIGELHDSIGGSELRLQEAFRYRLRTGKRVPVA